MKLLIITTNPKTLEWKSLPIKLAAIKEALNKTPNGTWDVSIEYRDIKPDVVDGHITHEWYNTISGPLFKAGFHCIYIHFTMKDWTKLGLDSSTRGFNQTDNDFVGESYGRGDENTFRGGTRKNQFIQNILHEMSHELAKATNVADTTHVWHRQHPDISGIFHLYDMENWQPVYKEQLRVKISIMQKLIDLLKQQHKEETYSHPVQYKPRIISQHYGRESTNYPRTGRHIGTDYALPIGTPLYAPVTGKVTAAGNGKATGNFCHFEYTFKGQVYEERWCHLKEIPRIETYKQGALVAKTGNTGDSTGPHLHREVWRGDVRVDLIDKKNWSELTLDPESLI